MTTEDLIADLRSRINPAYAALIGTESYERRLCADALEAQSDEIERLRGRLTAAPVAIMDTRDALGICAPAEEDFPALYALQGRRVRLVLDEDAA